jgi:hypothetical protein
MADEGDIRELIGRMSAAQRQGFHVTPAHLRIVLAALRFYLAARTWLAKPQGDPHDDPARKPPEKYTGPAATIGDLRRIGVVACQIQRAGPDCWRDTRVTFDALALPDNTALPDVPHLRRFRCSRCGCRQVRVTPDWTDYAAQGMGRALSSCEKPPGANG